jgi:cytochrome c5
MTLQEHAEAIKRAVEAAETAGFEVRIKDRDCTCCNDGVWITDPRTGEEAELDIY